MPGADAWHGVGHQALRNGCWLPVCLNRVYNPPTCMRPEPSLPRRRSVRLRSLDYSESHAYFLTICVQDRRPLLGRIVGTGIVLSEIGRVVDACWRDIPSHFPRVELATHIVMPDHLHGIIILREPQADGTVIAKDQRRARHAVPLREPDRAFAAPTVGSIPTIVGAFKAAVSHRVKRRNAGSIWQRGYYEHVIRDEEEFWKTCAYIRTNPARRAFEKDVS